MSHSQIFQPSPELFPFHSRWFESKAGRVHYIDEGHGPALIFLHGNAIWSFAFRHVIKQLCGQFRCIAIDYPGFGLSDRPERYGYTPADHAVVVASLLEHLSLDEMYIFGEGYGGPIGLAVALETPGRVKGFIMANTWFWPTDWLFNRMLGTFMCVPGIRKWSMKKNIFVEYILPRGITRTIDDVVMSHYRGVQPTPCMRVGIAELSRQLVAGRPWLATLERKVLDQLSDKPLLLIWGGSDPAFPAGHCVPRWRSAFYDCTYLYLPRARHFVQEDAPESVSGAIQTWHQGLDVPVYSNATTMIGNI